MLRILFYLVYIPLSSLFVRSAIIALHIDFKAVYWIIGVPTIVAIQIFERNIFKNIKTKIQCIIVFIPIITVIFLFILSAKYNHIYHFINNVNN